jgi:VWFA-related protein
MSSRLFLGLLGMALLCSTGTAQQGSEPTKVPSTQPPVTFKVQVEYVEVDAVVTDATGTFVRNLSRNDFEVREGGRLQELTVFGLVDVPIERSARSRAASLPIEPDVATNAQPFEGRLFLLVLDDLHTHPLRSQHVRSAARRFIDDYVGPNDLAAVVHTSGRSAASMNFSGNRRLLRTAIDQFVGRKPRSATLERLDEFFQVQRPPEEEFNSVTINDPLELERGELARGLLETLRRLGDWMADLRGRRKALVLFSEGIDYDIHNPTGGDTASLITTLTREAIAAVTRANIGIYAVDPRGVTALVDDVMEITELPSPEYYRQELGAGGLQNEVRRSQDSLRVLADETGGFAAVDSNSFLNAFDRVVRDSSTYYVLGYYPSDDRRDGRFRKIDVRVRRAGLQVRARTGYVAARGANRGTRSVEADSSTSRRLLEALQSPLPVTGLTLSTFAAPFSAGPSNASVFVTVEIDPSSARFPEQDGLFMNELELSLVALDHLGKTRDGHHVSVPFRLRPESHEAIMRSGFRVFSRLTLPPGRYQLRLAALDRAGGRVGSVNHDLEVPDFSRDPLTMSGLVLTSASARATPTAEPDVRFADVLPGPPTTRREFAVGDALALFAEVYDNAAGPSRTIDIVTTMRRVKGEAVFESKQTAAPEHGGARRGYAYTVRVPLRDIAPGPYVLRIEARAPSAGGPPVFRETPIVVVPTEPSR